MRTLRRHWEKPLRIEKEEIDRMRHEFTFRDIGNACAFLTNPQNTGKEEAPPRLRPWVECALTIVKNGTTHTGLLRVAGLFNEHVRTPSALDNRSAKIAFAYCLVANIDFNENKLENAPPPESKKAAAPSMWSSPLVKQLT